jgi:hypothetical protein
VLTMYLGAHNPAWLRRPELAGVPLFVSHNRLRERKSAHPPAITDWALDSGGFTSVTERGGFPDGPREYAGFVLRYQREIGRMAFAATQDWMCEEVALKRTGLTIAEHQRRTVESALRLTELAPDVPWLFALQGMSESDYLRCRDQYEAAGIATTGGRVFGLGSVCRRQATGEAEAIVERLTGEGMRLHLFGFKRDGLGHVANLAGVASADSLAWSYAGRKQSPCPEGPNVNCANCLHYALDWYDGTTLLARAAARHPRQMSMKGLWA